MKKMILFIFGIFLVANIGLFLHGLFLSEEISRYDSQIKKLQIENVELERQVDNTKSLSYALEMAKRMSFTEKTNFVFLGQSPYALQR